MQWLIKNTSFPAFLSNEKHLALGCSSWQPTDCTKSWDCCIPPQLPQRRQRAAAGVMLRVALHAEGLLTHLGAELLPWTQMHRWSAERKKRVAFGGPAPPHKKFGFALYEVAARLLSIRSWSPQIVLGKNYKQSFKTGTTHQKDFILYTWLSLAISATEHTRFLIDFTGWYWEEIHHDLHQNKKYH